MNIYTKFGSPTFNGLRAIKERRNFAEIWQHCLLVCMGFGPHGHVCMISKSIHTKFCACKLKDMEVNEESCFYENLGTLQNGWILEEEI
jgi:hypothetical protein